MKKLFTILMVLMMVTATACSETSDLKPQGDLSIIESGKSESSGQIVKPITGGGDFSAEKNY